MWLANQNPEVIFYLGAASTSLVAMLAISSQDKNYDKLVKNVIVWLVVVTIVYYIIDWLVVNKQSGVAWLMACLPLFGILIHFNNTFAVKHKNLDLLTSNSYMSQLE